MQNDYHHLRCKAPICKSDPNPNYKNEVIWRPGEEVCHKKLYERFQKKQIEINRLFAQGKFKDRYEGYTAHMLETLSI